MAMESSGQASRKALTPPLPKAKSFEPLPAVAVKAYLESYGFAAKDAETWHTGLELAASSPKLTLEVGGHQEWRDHTFYSMKCSISSKQEEEKCYSWLVRYRLAQLREELHDKVKESLGDDYARHFGITPFCLRGGLPGTTARLHNWCKALANAVNAGALRPWLVAFVLQFLEVPQPALPQPKQEVPSLPLQREVDSTMPNIECDDVEIEVQ
eukprot:TRINITY_DN63536_c0_g1_i1.p1 TRINITY_DN63536_c0_g1~~TRINITY_DN63536_c0_g1_i1.p1  ORF type:complete len:249 (+),score=60.69 TRINITY_DN63536_c0_g1_i1:113-748(+)